MTLGLWVGQLITQYGRRKEKKKSCFVEDEFSSENGKSSGM